MLIAVITAAAANNGRAPRGLQPRTAGKGAATNRSGDLRNQLAAAHINVRRRNRIRLPNAVNT
jgi:hypothetical protein